MQKAVRVVFTESPQVRCGCRLGLAALQHQGRQREFFQTTLGQQRKPRKALWCERKAFRFSACCLFSAFVGSTKRFVFAASANALQICFLRMPLIFFDSQKVVLPANVGGCSKSDDVFDDKRNERPQYEKRGSQYEQKRKEGEINSLRDG